MCGIVGLVGAQEASWLTEMNALIPYRGPDDAGEYRDREAGVALAMRRLSILDLAGGHQPMSNHDGSVWIVYNGETYNSPPLREHLLSKGYEFQTSHSDTEVLLHLYEEKQEAMLDDLNGMFAFVIYDRERRQLFGARDRFGIKPLYYHKSANLFAFASELKCFLPLPGIERAIDLASLYHYMSLLYVPGEDSIMRGIKRLLPAHWFKFDLRSNDFKTEQYWDIDLKGTEERSEDEWCEIIRTELREAVRRWTLSDVPVGCSLSGGIDSSAIVGLLGEMGHPGIKTYSLGFTGHGEDEWNELPLAREVAARWGTEHHESILDPESLLDDLVEMAWHLDEPYGGGLPSWYVFRFMRETVTVGLTGTGGDETFGNYGKFRAFEATPLARAIMSQQNIYTAAGRNLAWLWKPAAQLAEAVPQSWLGGRARKERLSHWLNFSGGPLGRYYFNPWYYFSDEAKRAAVFQTDLGGVLDTAEVLQGFYERAGASDVRNAIAYVDFKTQLTDEFLLMTDRLSMAHSLEARVPFLDHEFVETIFRIPSQIRTRPDNLKYLLKKSVADLLPEGILGARKRGFVIPIKLWLRGSLRPLAEYLLAPERLKAQGILNPQYYRRYVKPHLDGEADYTWQVWAALMFQLWHFIFIEQNTRQKPTYSWRDIIK
ncbi:MAG TPA: asparagine synthase (glutamine-hydrolyzing) [Pyrinomonadaceae bacterium]|jgi:asparagine synthase (glutamine-hydrolysing)|nr:asparagine synthase (glutamine-hydrolyzing) [Pyrinomonadaceae bacterium]